MNEITTPPEVFLPQGFHALVLLIDDQALVAEMVRRALAGQKDIDFHYCHKVRNDNQYWQKIETYLTEHSNLQFSHGLCPDCYEKASKELDQELAAETRRKGKAP